MTNLITLHRAFVINRVLIHHGLDEFLAPTPLSKMTRLLKIFALSGNKKGKLSRGERLNLALTELGPIFVKLGQMLSTRRDLLPQDIADELAKLQDQVEPFDSQVAIKIIEDRFKQPIGEIFASFESEPLASASVAQVHSAVLKNGDEVVVKIIRPDIQKRIQADLKLLKLLAGWFEKYSSTGRRLHAVDVIRDYHHTLMNELDLRIEAANTSQLRRNFENSPVLYVPQIYWDYSRRNIMVQEKIHGIPIGDIKALHKAGVDMEVLANRGVEIFFTQVFKHSYFHADMHPGNIFVDVTDPMQPKYIGIDCGIMGMLSEVDKRYLAQNFDAFFNRDYKRIAQLHLDSGWVPAHVSVEQFESAIRAACEPIFGKPLDEISFGHFLVQLFHTARQFDMEVQTQLVLLQKTLLYVEGLGRQLYPKLDLWKTAKPFLRDWLSETYGIKAVLNKLKDKAPEWLEQIPEIPDKVNQVVHHLKTQSENQKVLAENMEKLSDSQKSLKKSLRWSLLGVGLILLSFVSLPEVISWPYIKETLLGLSAVSFVLSFRQ